MNASLDNKEVERFDTIAKEWWDRDGKFKPLHRLNPARILYIREQFITHFECNHTSPTPLAGLRIADIGCGGGLISEPLARLGADVTGIDPSPETISAARSHASLDDLRINYINGTVEDLIAAEQRFDGVLTLEVVEHVPDLAAFLRSCAQILKPGGLLVLSTLNRTAKSFALGIVAAEYILRWLPRGTHNWSRFVTPDELSEKLKEADLTPMDRRGLTFNPITDSWKLGNDCSVNYFMTARK